jgi:hypothetical protein
MLDVRHANWNKPGTPCVSVLESPSSEDLLQECQEGRALQTALHQARIPCRYYLATNKARFTDGLRFIAQQRHHDEQKIALHISCHGNEHGIALTNEEFVTWPELAAILLEFARDAMAYHEGARLSSVILCMSACPGLAAVQMAKGEERPFMSLVAAKQAVSWSDCLVSFLAFYNLFLIKNATLAEAVTAMNVVAGIEDMFHVVDFSDEFSNALHYESSNDH